MPKPSLPLSQPPDAVCLLRLSALGDVSHMVPIVRSIQTQWPHTRLAWCLGRLEYQLVGDLPGVEFYQFDKSKGWRALFELRRRIGAQPFDVLIHAQVSMRANLASLAIRAPVRLGYDHDRARDLHGLFVNQRIPAASGQHVLDSFFSFASTLGVTHRELRWDIPVPLEARDAAARLPGDGPVLVISPCSSHPLRNWRADRYARVADYAAKQYGFRIVLCGGPSALERRMGDAISAAMMASAPIDLIGKDTIKQLLAVLERASLLIAPDSGPMHLATATGTPVIGLHAASNPQRSGPYLSRQWCVDRYDAAARQFLGRPAADLKWGTKIERPGVMDLVTVDDVIERLDAFMAAGVTTQA
ncbi:MAG: glycosyltransferase family 9 protein [Gammaproteobacteria bacterium]